jgi:hypothetical protein
MGPGRRSTRLPLPSPVWCSRKEVAHARADSGTGRAPPGSALAQRTVHRCGRGQGRDRCRAAHLRSCPGPTPRLVTMFWGWILRRIASRPDRTGLFGYLVTRDRNRCQIKLESARQEATKDLIDHLPCGAVYREGAADSWREIWMPPEPRSQLFVLPVVHHEPAHDPCDPEPPQPPRVLDKDQPNQIDDSRQDPPSS